MKYVDCFFIWNNKYEDGGRIFIWIDRVLVNEQLFDFFFICYYKVVFEGVLDYCFMNMIFLNEMQQKKKLFNFFNMWVKCENFLNIVEFYWNRQVQGTKIILLVIKLKILKYDLRKLNRESFYGIEEKYNMIRGKFISIQEDMYDDFRNFEIQVLGKGIFKEFW